MMYVYQNYVSELYFMYCWHFALNAANWGRLSGRTRFNSSAKSTTRFETRVNAPHIVSRVKKKLTESF